MTVIISPLTLADREAVTRLLDDAVGAGFRSLDSADETLSFVARGDGEASGVLLACLAAAEAFPTDAGVPGATPDVPGDDRAVLHVRELAVAAGQRRGGVATRLLRRAEREGRARGASLALVYAWLPAGLPDPEVVPFYAALGYSPRAELPGFYFAASVAAGAVCPYCGDPPCRCAARALAKQLPAPA